MAKTKHHHGNLREALIKAGIAMLTEGEPLTLRGAAQRAGVSHAAPAHHFQGLNGLRTAIAAQALTDLGNLLNKTGRNPDHGPFERLLEMGLAYHDFATGHHQLFHLMFVSAEVDRADPALVEASGAAYSHLRRACAPFLPDQTPEDEVLVMEHAIWSMTHGHALLEMQDVTRSMMAPTATPSLESQYRLLLGPRLPTQP